MNPILFVDLFKQSSYKTTILLSIMYKQLTYFSKKYSKSTRTTLHKINKLSVICNNNNIKAIKHICKKTTIDHEKILLKVKFKNTKIIRYFINNYFDIEYIHNYFFDPYDNFIHMCNTKYFKYFTHSMFDSEYTHEHFFEIDSISINDKRKNYYRSIKLLLDKGVNVCLCKNNMLKWSAVCGCINIIKLLLDSGADINTNHCFVFKESARGGNVEIVKLLLDRDANIHGYKSAILTQSVLSGNIELVKYLLDKYININEIDSHAFNVGVKYGKFEIVKLLLEKDANVHAENYNWMLELSIIYSHIDIFELLWNYGSTFTNSVLECVAYGDDNIEIIKKLLEKIDPTIIYDFQKLLEICAEKNKTNIINYLFENIPNINPNYDELLIKSAQYGNTNTVKLLLNKGANIHAMEDLALRMSVKHNKIETTEFLLEYGADVQANNNEPLRYCAINNNYNTRMMKIILKYGADVHINNNEPLRTCAENGNIPMMELLLVFGANIYMINIEKVPQNIKKYIRKKIEIYYEI